MNGNALGPGLRLRWAIALLAVAGLGLAGLGCQEPSAPIEGVQLGVTVDQILAQPERYVGQSVATSVEVQRTIGERAIVLQSQVAGHELIAVLSDQAARHLGAIQAGQTVNVVGTVERLTPEQIRQVEKQLGIDLDEEQLLSLANQAPFLIVRNASR